jgi:hypothetical protein
MTGVLINPSKFPVSESPTELLGALGPDDQITIANFDITNDVYVGYSPGISSTSNNTTQIRPLGSAVVSASRKTWIVCAPGKTAIVQLIPGSAQWTPSPADVSAQINALGLAKDTTLQTTNTKVDGTTTAVGGTTTAVGGTTAAVNAISGQFVSKSLYSTGTVNLPGAATPNFINLAPITPVSLTGSGLSGTRIDFFSSYEVSMTNIDPASGTGVFTIIFQWFNDPADTVPVDQITWSVPSNLTPGIIVLGKGPMRGNYLAVQAASNDGIGITSTISFKLTGSLRDSPAGDDWRASGVGLGGNASSAKAWTNVILYSVGLNIPVGSVVRDALLYSGPVTIYMENNSTNGILIASFAAQLAPNPVLWRGSVPQNPTGTTPTLINLKFPRAPVTMTVGNSGAAAGALDVTVVADRV